MHNHKKNTVQESSKELKKQLIKDAFLVISTFIALCMIGIAWFVSNSRVDATGVQVSAQGARFSLASIGAEGRYDKNDEAFVQGSSMTIEGVTYICSNNNIVSWMATENDGTSESSFMNIDQPKLSQKNILRPGSNGQITFYIISRVDNLEALTIDLSLIPYTDWDNTDTTVTKPEDAIDTVQYEMKNGSFQPAEITVVPITTDTTEGGNIYSLMQGHILFFQDCNDREYSNWIQDGQIVVSPPNGATYFEKNKPQKVTLYWVWPLKFDSYVTESNNIVRLFTGDGEWNKFFNEIKINRKKYLSDSSNILPDELNLYLGMEQRPKLIEPYRTCYNEGDQLIGENVRFVMLKVEAKEE